jgi:RNA methyltransferase, TrmH family
MMPCMAELPQVGRRHPAVELVRDIQRNRTGIPRRTFVAEGLFENNVVLEAGVAVDTFLWCPEAAYSDEARTRSSQLAARARRAYRISEKTLTYLAERPNPDGLISIARLPDPDPEAVAFGPNALILVIDGIEIPGNLG